MKLFTAAADLPFDCLGVFLRSREKTFDFSILRLLYEPERRRSLPSVKTSRGNIWVLSLEWHLNDTNTPIRIDFFFQAVTPYKF
jgi:hypothetical protein